MSPRYQTGLRGDLGVGAPRAEVSGLLVRRAGAGPGGVQARVWKRPISQMVAVTIWKQLTGSLLPHYTPPPGSALGGGVGVTVVWVVWVPQPSPAEQGFVNEIPTLPGRCHGVRLGPSPRGPGSPGMSHVRSPAQALGVPRGLPGPGKMGVRKSSMKKKASVGG